MVCRWPFESQGWGSNGVNQAGVSAVARAKELSGTTLDGTAEEMAKASRSIDLGGEIGAASGNRTLRPHGPPVSCRIHVATIASNTTVARVPCRRLPPTAAAKAASTFARLIDEVTMKTPFKQCYPADGPFGI